MKNPNAAKRLPPPDNCPYVCGESIPCPNCRRYGITPRRERLSGAAPSRISRAAERTRSCKPMEPRLQAHEPDDCNDTGSAVITRRKLNVPHTYRNGKCVLLPKSRYAEAEPYSRTHTDV